MRIALHPCQHMVSLVYLILALCVVMVLINISLWSNIFHMFIGILDVIFFEMPPQVLGSFLSWIICLFS